MQVPHLLRRCAAGATAGTGAAAQAVRAASAWAGAAGCSGTSCGLAEETAYSLASPSVFPAQWRGASSERPGSDFFWLEEIHRSRRSGARVGRLHTPHGCVDTPAFVMVATNGTPKCLDLRQADAAGTQLIFCNTYHLLLQPGPEVVEAAGGLHRFLNRPDRPIITDSGGFQVFSLQHRSDGGDPSRAHKPNAPHLKASSGKHRTWRSSVLKVDESGVRFRSYRDGSLVELTPESSVRAQKAYGADIIIPLDELPPYDIKREALEESVHRSHRWMARSLQEHLRDIRQQAMYGVVHGGVDKQLRQLSADYLTQLPFDGYAIGGALGKDRQEMIDLLQFVVPQLPSARPIHLLGIADEQSILKAVPLGIDTFDSAFPTRVGRHGGLLTRNGRIRLQSGQYARAFRPIDEHCDCPVCSHYSLAYLHHLYKAHEPLAETLATLHNVHYMCSLMSRVRALILEDRI